MAELIHNELPMRISARVLLFNPAGEILLFHSYDKVPVDPWRENIPYWATIGGGLEAGETIEECARREVLEETGIDDVGRLTHVWRLHQILHIDGRPTLCDERYVHARTDSTCVDTGGLGAREAAATIGHRWWSIEAIRTSEEVFLPDGLTVLIERVARGDLSHKSETRL